MFKKLFIALCLAAVSCCGVDMIKSNPAKLGWDKVKPMPFYRWVEGGAPPIDTEARFMYDDNRLYIRLVCSEPNITEARQQPRLEGHDSPVWTNDCVEIFIDPRDGSGRLFQFVSDIHNGGAELLWNDARYANTAAWNGYWSHKTTYFEDKYIVDVEIPWRSLGISAAKNKDIGINITRVRKIAPWGRYVLSEKMDKHLVNMKNYLTFGKINLTASPLSATVNHSVPLAGSNSVSCTIKSVAKNALPGKMQLIASVANGETVLAEVPITIPAGGSVSKNFSYQMKESGSIPVKVVFCYADGSVADLWADNLKFNPPLDINVSRPIVGSGADTAFYLRIYLTKFSGNALVEIRDAASKVVAARKQPLRSKEFFITIPSAKLAPGDYNVSVTVCGFKQTIPLKIVPNVF